MLCEALIIDTGNVYVILPLVEDLLGSIRKLDTIVLFQQDTNYSGKKMQLACCVEWVTR